MSCARQDLSPRTHEKIPAVNSELPASREQHISEALISQGNGVGDALRKSPSASTGSIRNKEVGIHSANPQLITGAVGRIPIPQTNRIESQGGRLEIGKW